MAAKKTSNVWRKGDLAIDVTTGTKGKGEVSALVKRTLPDEKAAARTKIVNEFMDWQRGQHGQRVAEATNELSQLVAELTTHGFELDAAVSANGGFTIKGIPPAGYSLSGKGNNALRRLAHFKRK